MATEPETAVPLAYFSPYQIIVLGDEQQCGPVVVSARAQSLGFGCSLFQRAVKKSAIWLTQHYRMVGLHTR